MSDAGHIIGGPADPDYDGAVLTADLAVGDLVLHVDDVADFDEDAAERDGRVIIGLELDGDGNLDPTTGTALAYTTCDDDTGTVTLLAASSVAASSGDRVYIANPVSGLPVGQVGVMVAIDDSDTTGDALPAVLDLALLDSAGDVDLTEQAVDLEEDDDGQLVVMGLPGLAQASGDVKFMQDQLTVTALGDQTLSLTYRPIKNSEHLYWNGDYQPGSEWARDQWDVTIPDADGLIEVGDTLVMEYAYKDPTTKPADPGAHPDIVIDLPAFHVTDPGGVGSHDELSTTDTGSEMVLAGGEQLGVGYFGAGPDESTSGNGVRVNLPDEPGYALTHATYVAIAYRAASDAAPAPGTSDYADYSPTPSSWPFLSLDTSGTISWYTLDDLPVGAYAGESVWPGSELLHFLTDPVGSQLPSNRVWNESNGVAVTAIHIAYYAIRLTYVWVG